ncbi:MAG TPA: septum formation initiator family protein, partial [Nocardioides sp.]
AILVLVLAVLTVSYASSLRAYLTQRAHLDDLRAQIEEKTANIEAYEREQRRWDDDAYVEQQARERLDYVNPGETSYVVIGEDGQPVGADDGLSDPVAVPDDEEVPPAWWDTAWDSVSAAGDPQEAAEEEAERQPADEIGPPPEQTEEQTEEGTE